MYNAHCDICYNHLPINQFRVLSCGHCFCSGCTTSLKKRHSPTCPKCRTSITVTSVDGRREDGQPLYITIVDPEQDLASDNEDALIAQAKHVEKGLGKMGDKSSYKTVQRAEKEIRKVVDGISAEGKHVQEMLLDAISDFSSRIVPVFAEVETLRALKTSAAFEQDTALTLLRADLEKKERFSRTAMDVAERAKNDVVRLRKVARELRERAEAAEKKAQEAIEIAERAKETAREKSEEVAQLAEHWDESKKKISAQRAKLKGLQDQLRHKDTLIKSLREPLDRAHNINDVDDSLCILPPNEDENQVMPLTPLASFNASRKPFHRTDEFSAGSSSRHYPPDVKPGINRFDFKSDLHSSLSSRRTLPPPNSSLNRTSTVKKRKLVPGPDTECNSSTGTSQR